MRRLSSVLAMGFGLLLAQPEWTGWVPEDGLVQPASE
jgi:hypothetical protein